MSLASVVRNLRDREKLWTPTIDAYIATHSHVEVDRDWALNRLLPLLTEDENGPASRIARFGASSRGSCYRAQIFGYIGLPVTYKNPEELFGIFIDGHFRHIKWQALLKAAGLVDDVETKHNIPRYRVKSSWDGEAYEYITKDGRKLHLGVEVKGMGPHKHFKEVHDKGVAGMPDGHPLQIETMMASEPDVEAFIYIAEYKVNSEWVEVVVKRDPGRTQAVIDELEELNQYVDNEELPPILKECAHGKGPTFRDCPYKKRCLGTTSWSKAEQEVGSKEVVREQEDHKKGKRRLANRVSKATPVKIRYRIGARREE